MMKTLKLGVAKIRAGITVVCGVMVLSVAMLAAVPYRLATKRAARKVATKFTSESVHDDR